MGAFLRALAGSDASPISGVRDARIAEMRVRPPSWPSRRVSGLGLGFAVGFGGDLVLVATARVPDVRCVCLT